MREKYAFVEGTVPGLRKRVPPGNTDFAKDVTVM